MLGLRRGKLATYFILTLYRKFKIKFLNYFYS